MLISELATRYRTQYADDPNKLFEAVNEINAQALSRRGKPFRIVAVHRDGDRWVAFLEREAQSLMEYVASEKP